MLATRTPLRNLPVESPDGLHAYKLDSAPPTVYYVPSFITSREAEYLRDKVYSAPKPKWTVLRNRRLQNWGVNVGDGARPALVAEQLPDWLMTVAEKIAQLGVWDLCEDGKGRAIYIAGKEHMHPNNCLINEYLRGQGILPHEDGPAFLPAVATVSLGGHCVLDLYRHRDEESTPTSSSPKPDYSILLQPNSLFIITDTAYTAHLHGIAEREEDVLRKNEIINCKEAGLDFQGEGAVVMKRTETRVSLTFRVAKRVAKTKIGHLLGRK